MANDAAKFVGSIPENYDKCLGPHIFAGYAEDLTRRVAALNPAAVLELAAGTGILSRKLRDALADQCELIASDLNPPMLEVAKAKFRAGELIRFEEVDATDLPFDDASVDVIVCQFGVMFFPDKHRSYTEARRVLRPGGHYLFNVWDSWDRNFFAQTVHQTVESFFPGNPPGFYQVPFGYHDAGEIEESLSRAGFTRVSVEPVAIDSTIRSAADFAQGLVFGNPLHEEIVNLGGDPEEVCAAVAAAVDRELGSEMRLQALVVDATR
jgi:ubiquinone/menaquinone biosynthesis C-methylase UbiE